MASFYNIINYMAANIQQFAVKVQSESENLGSLYIPFLVSKPMDHECKTWSPSSFALFTDAGSAGSIR